MSTLSVIIPAYNAAAFLDSTLASVAGQTRQPDEVVVVDDGSTDDTVAIARRWQAILPIELVELGRNVGRGGGAGAARHAGIERSKGDLIALLDADDVWLPDHLEVMVATHERYGGLVTANHLRWVQGERLGLTPSTELVPVPPPEEQRLAIIGENSVFIGSLFSRRLYDDAGGFESIKCEDWDLWIRMVRCGARISVPPTVTSLYRTHPNSVSSADHLLDGDVALLERMLPGAEADERRVIAKSLRRKRARQHLLAGYEHARQGATLRARVSWVRAAVLDRDLRRDSSRLSGSVTVRALACIVAPTAMVRRRDGRRQDPAVLVDR